MADQQLSAAVRPNSRVRRTNTRSGVTQIREFQPNRYTIIGNHLSQHDELSLTAIGLATYILSLPDGALVDIRTLAARFKEGRDRISFALRELETHGYFERVRERGSDGLMTTRTYSYNAPEITRASAASAATGEEAPPPPPLPAPVEPTCEQPVQPVPSVPLAAPVPPAAPVPSVPPALPVPSAPPVPLVAPVPPVPPAPPAPAQAPRSEHYDKAVALLVGLRRTDDRLTLPERDVRRLAPAAAAWFGNGATSAALYWALTADLPADLRNPAGLLAHRLRELLPPPLPALPALPAAQAGPVRSNRPDPFQNCDGCERAFRAPAPGRCRDCRPHTPTNVDTAA